MSTAAVASSRTAEIVQNIVHRLSPERQQHLRDFKLALGR
jgi:hypothetical protein